MSVCNYTNTALEAISRRELKQYDISILSGEPRKIDIEAFIEQIYGLTIEYHHIRIDGRVLGQTIFEDCCVPIFDTEIKNYTLIEVQKGTIIIDTRLLSPCMINRYRFTLAHELAHWILHQEQFRDSGETAAMLKISYDTVHIEKQADMLASMLLMPYGQVKKAYYRLMVNEKSGVTKSLAKLFGVSEKTMTICLTSHNLI